MKNILIMPILVVILVGAIALNFIIPVSGTIYSRVSDSVTAPDLNWSSPAELEKGRIALDKNL